MLRILISTGNIFVSLVLGALAFGFVFIKFPETMSHILDGASRVKGWLTTVGTSDSYNNWMRVLLEERQLVFMGFTIFVRLLLAIIGHFFLNMFRRSS
ncbi:MAG: hypothetical protein ACRBCJ_11545 [Hyphomicrobiaceae bacterium]